MPGNFFHPLTQKGKCLHQAYSGSDPVLGTWRPPCIYHAPGPCSKPYNSNTHVTVCCRCASWSLQIHRFGLAAKDPILWSPQSEILKILVLPYFPPESHLRCHEKYCDTCSYSRRNSAFVLRSSENVNKLQTGIPRAELGGKWSKMIEV